MDTVKENVRAINLMLFLVNAFILVITLFSVLRWLFYGSVFFNFLLMCLAPAFGLVYLFVLSKGKSKTQHAMFLGITHAAGFLIMLIQGVYGFWAVLMVLAYLAGVAANGIVLFNK